MESDSLALFSSGAAAMGFDKVVVIDCRAHMLGRLASVIAKELLAGQKVVCVRAEEITISGGIVRQHMKYDRFLAKRMVTNPRKGPYHFRAPAKILWRTIRGMIPHKTARGQEALKRFIAYEGIPAPYDTVKRAVVPDALKVLRLQSTSRFCKLGDLSNLVGWKHQATVKALEEKRKVKSAAFYADKKKAKVAVAKVAASVK